MSSRTLLIFFFAFLISPLTHAQVAELTKVEKYIQKKLPNAKIKKLTVKDHFREVYEIKFEQYLDHNNPATGTFEHRIFLAHTDKKKPVVFVTEGYAARQRTYELSKILNANQIIVEYRFYGGSRPDKIKWQYLTNDQATKDLHRIRKIFKKLYRKEWISTGISKGGTTTLIYKSKYPKDVCVAVPYVAPLAFAQEDPRTDVHQQKVGSEACRKKIIAFQRWALQKREELIPMIEAYAKKNRHTFSIGEAVVLEYAVLEFPFSFWQWGADCATLPNADATAKEIFDHIEKVVSWSFYSDNMIDYFLPAFYQFMTELGYYGFPTENVNDLLVAVKNPTNRLFAPKNVDLTFEPYLKPVNDFLMKKGKRVLYIYGGLDTWYACGVTPNPKTDALAMVLEDGAHQTRIKDFPKEDQTKIYKKLDKWLRAKVTPLEE
ncbi:MAG: S28 family serine protease [Bacteroidota bacterium]